MRIIERFQINGRDKPGHDDLVLLNMTEETMPGLAGLFSLDGRVALVTGASRGLGFAMAEALAEAGATVLINGRDAASAAEAAGALRDRGLKAQPAAFDVTDHDAAAAAVDAIVAEFGRLDILICNAGYTHRAALADWTLEDWNAMLAIHVRASFFLAQKVAAPMRRNRYGRIICTTSITALKGRATIHGYAAAKSALAGLARSLAAELGEDGITCNSIAPGYFETDLTKPLLADEAFVARVNSRVALRRWGKPRDLAGAAVFLASEASSYVTGQQIVVDGGFTTTI
jgi:gluconate 5-dehydrogenase